MTNDEAEMLLFDRKVKIQSIMRQYGEENFHLSFSGGKDSTVLHYLVDEALPGNKIPRVFVNTGIEMNSIVRFVRDLAAEDDRIKEIRPKVPIKKMLEEEGYPFKSKLHALCVHDFQTRGMIKYVKNYYEGNNKRDDKNCPKILKYQFENDLPFKISDLCCDRLKKDPLYAFETETERPYAIVGLRREEGGRRAYTNCVVWRAKKMHFHPLAVVTEEWMDWYTEKGHQTMRALLPSVQFREDRVQRLSVCHTTTEAARCPASIFPEREGAVRDHLEAGLRRIPEARI